MSRDDEGAGLEYCCCELAYDGAVQPQLRAGRADAAGGLPQGQLLRLG